MYYNKHRDAAGRFIKFSEACSTILHKTGKSCKPCYQAAAQSGRKEAVIVAGVTVAVVATAALVYHTWEQIRK